MQLTQFEAHEMLHTATPSEAAVSFAALDFPSGQRVATDTAPVLIKYPAATAVTLTAGGVRVASHVHLVAFSGHLVTTPAVVRYDPSLALVQTSAPLVPVLLHSAHSPVQAAHTTGVTPSADVFLNPTDLHAVHVARVSQVAHPEVALLGHSTQVLVPDFVS